MFRAASTIHLSHTAETGERVEGEEGGGETERTASPAISAIPHRKISQNYWYRPNRPMTTLVFPDLAVGAASQSIAFLVDVEAHGASEWHVPDDLTERQKPRESSNVY